MEMQEIANAELLQAKQAVILESNFEIVKSGS